MSLYPGKPCTRCRNNCKSSYVCNCCPWCCEECNKGFDRCYECFTLVFMRKKGTHAYVCDNFKCAIKCKGKELKCECKCCKEKCASPGACQAPPPPPPPPIVAPSGVESVIVGQPQLSALSTEEHSEDDPDDDASQPFRPDPQAIAAVIVGIIVAIILLDLCIFRFPVGRNIRDFVVRKIPFCIAFYS
ncbi:hypothetical protein BBBOND_0307890 [Babesia bigemina]|uniref:Uncharacterized protein n=1 Tax=Babesia bigemina TaxID=5866 RepID=A0A061DE72_BABBI|nr:hypothetical protein BBBOND_0307890 [Babesia bigemina]CDR96885.1 hypothetical protein BBBOND_0307890 [Babesia bigemina]|eukprot:XP_012769071.1 hypothetical protein BBBOND_0307890 [Babesia bigemina]